MYCMYETTYFSPAYAATNSESVTQDTLAGPAPPQPSLVTHVYRAWDFGCVFMFAHGIHCVQEKSTVCMHCMYVYAVYVCMYVCTYLVHMHKYKCDTATECCAHIHWYVADTTPHITPHTHP